MGVREQVVAAVVYKRGVQVEALLFMWVRAGGHADLVEQVLLLGSDLQVSLREAILAVLWKGVGVRTIWLGLVMVVVALSVSKSTPAMDTGRE